MAADRGSRLSGRLDQRNGNGSDGGVCSVFAVKGTQSVIAFIVSLVVYLVGGIASGGDGVLRTDFVVKSHVVETQSLQVQLIDSVEVADGKGGGRG
jgi:hypothetical protein